MDDLQKIQQKQANLMNENWNHAVDRTNNVEKDFYRMQKESELIDDIKFSELLEENGVEMITRFPTTYLATDKKSIDQYNKDLKEAQKLAKGKKVMVTGHTIRFLKAADRRVENIDKLMVDALGKIEIKEVKEKSDYYEESAEDRTQRILNKIQKEIKDIIPNIMSYYQNKFYIYLFQLF